MPRSTTAQLVLTLVACSGSCWGQPCPPRSCSRLLNGAWHDGIIRGSTQHASVDAMSAGNQHTSLHTTMHTLPQCVQPCCPHKVIRLSTTRPCTCLSYSGRASGGPGPQLAFTQSGVPLDVNALLFTTILADSMPITSDSSSKLLTQGGWGIIATAGSEPNTISTTWFQDSSFGTCGITSFTAAVPSDTCTLTFKVVAGSVLGVSAPDGAKCPAGTHPVTHPDNTQSCFACSAGYAFKGGKCMACSGNFYQPNWGDVPDCKPCKGGGYATSFDATSNWFCYSNETPRFKDN